MAPRQATPPGSARLADVARAAGVSAMTVSRALRMPGRVAPETRARVEEAVRALGYVPNLVAGALRSQRSRIVVAIVPTLTSSIFAETVEGMTEALRAQDHQLLLANSGYAPETEEDLVRAFLGRRPDGMILTGVHHTAGARAQLRAAGIPVVETWELGDAPLDMNVGFSNRDAGRRLATEGRDPKDHGRPKPTHPLKHGSIVPCPRRRAPLRLRASPAGVARAPARAYSARVFTHPDQRESTSWPSSSSITCATCASRTQAARRS